MCGIAGTTKPDFNLNISRMIEVMRHRGYDGDYFHVEKGKIGLGMNRLAINDSSQDLYPFKHKHFVLFFNGEVYNHDEIFKRYLKGKFDRKTTCDAEVILPLFELFGIKAFSFLEGMFSLCIFDTSKSKIYLARDTFGEKQLYYTTQQGHLSFGSELKSILSLSYVKKEISLLDLADYLATGSTFESTLLKGIKKVQPGTCVSYALKSKKINTTKYVVPTELHIDSDNSLDQLDILLSQAVKKRATEHAHIFLSGGIDSSLLTYYSTQHSKKTATYSINFPENFIHNESYFSNQIARYFDTDHYQIDVTYKMILPVIANIGLLIDHPFSDPACIPTYVLAKLASKNTRVALAGEGADELFGGYGRYRDITGDAFNFLGLESNKNEYIAQRIWADAQLLNLGLDSGRTKVFARSLQQKQLQDLNHYLPDQLLAKSDVFSMRHNLELRAPFLDSKLLAFSLQLNNSQKVNVLGTKFILRKIALRYLPLLTIVRPKHGFSVPINNWMRNGNFFKNSFIDMLEDTSIINKKIALKYLVEHVSGTANHKHKLWSLYVFFSWARANGISY